MKNNTQPAASKLVKKFDNELKDLLMADLKAIKAKGLLNNKLMQVSTAAAA